MSGNEPGALTLDKLRALMDAMPPKETWLSSSLFPRETAYQLKADRENFLVAHPDFWLRFRHEVRRREAVAPPPPIASPFSSSLGGVPIIELDPFDGDDEDTAKWRRGELQRFVEAFAKALGVDLDPFGWKAMAKFGFNVPGAEQTNGRA